jgi:hypothetical protein
MDTKEINKICITSYNSTGFGLHQQNYIETLSLFSDMVCLQEHFLLDAKDRKQSNTNKIRKTFGNKFDMYIVPAQKPNDSVSRGRGKGGLAILWKKYLTKYVSKVPCSNFRILAAKFSLPSSSLLRADNFDETDLLERLDDLGTVVKDSNCRNLLWTGDLNCDFSQNTRFVEIVQHFISDLNLMVFWSNPNESIQTVDFSVEQTIRGVTFRSVIDHFVSTENVFKLVSEAGVIHSGEYISNHSAIYCKI